MSPGIDRVDMTSHDNEREQMAELYAMEAAEDAAEQVALMADTPSPNPERDDVDGWADAGYYDEDSAS